MNARTVSGALGILVVIATVVFGVGGFFRTFVVDTHDGAAVAPTMAILAVTVLVVVGLSAAGIRSREWLENPYW